MRIQDIFLIILIFISIIGFTSVYAESNSPVVKAPVANFSVSVRDGGNPLTVSFTDFSTNNPSKWDWDFGDGVGSSKQNPLHVYTTPGTYSISLTVSNSAGANKFILPQYIKVNSPSENQPSSSNDQNSYLSSNWLKILLDFLSTIGSLLNTITIPKIGPITIVTPTPSQTSVSTPITTPPIWPITFTTPSPSPTSVSTTIAPIPKKQPAISIPDLEQQIHSLVNQERNKNGLASLSYDSRLANIARAHSQDMAKRNYLSHDTPEGGDLSSRFATAGYFPQKIPGIYSGENIHLDNLASSITYYDSTPSYNWKTQDEIAQSTIQGWMNSPGHRQSILTSAFHVEGIGVAISGDNKVYVTEDFVAGSPTTLPSINPLVRTITNQPVTTTVQPKSTTCSITGKWSQTEYQGKPQSGAYILIHSDNKIELFSNNKLTYSGTWETLGPNQFRTFWTFGQSPTSDTVTISSDCKTTIYISDRGEHSTWVRA